MTKVRTSVMPGNHGYPDLPVFLAENSKRAICFLNRNSMWQNNSQSGWPVLGGTPALPSAQANSGCAPIADIEVAAELEQRAYRSCFRLDRCFIITTLIFDRP